MLPLADDEVLLTGTLGDIEADSMFIAALAENGPVVWRHVIPFDDDELSQHYLRHAVGDNTWWVASGTPQSVVRQYDGDGIEVASTPLADLLITDVEARPDGGLLLMGIESTATQTPMFAGIDPNGIVEWRGQAVVPTFERATASGTIQRLDAEGTEQWAHDPRPAPFELFPEHPGAQWARLMPGGNTAAFGSVLAEGGWAAQVVWLDPSGAPLVEIHRRSLTVTQGERLPNGWVSLYGIATECERARWHGVYDEQGALLHEHVFGYGFGLPEPPVTVDSSHRPVLVHLVNASISVQRFAQVAL